MIRIIIIEDEAAAAERLEQMLMTMPFDIKMAIVLTYSNFLPYVSQ